MGKLSTVSNPNLAPACGRQDSCQGTPQRGMAHLKNIHGGGLTIGMVLGWHGACMRSKGVQKACQLGANKRTKVFHNKKQNVAI